MPAYEDTVPGLAELAKSAFVIALSNGSYRLLVDMVCFRVENRIQRVDDVMCRQRTSSFRGTASCRPSFLESTSRTLDSIDKLVLRR